jgi:hypothetical protein
MARFLPFTLLGLALLAGCTDPTGSSLALVSDQERACEAEREAARVDAGFRLQAAAARTGYAGSDEAALALDRQDARVASDIAQAAFERCMAGE